MGIRKRAGRLGSRSCKILSHSHKKKVRIPPLMSNAQTQYGLPETVKFCTRCVTSNTCPSSMNEYQHKGNTKHEYLGFDKEGVCGACRFTDAKYDGTIDWDAREKELKDVLDRYRSKDGSYDVLVPGSGGKDSCFASHILKYKYGMHPLTVTWSPHLYTDVGWRNFQNWLHVGGFDNYLCTPNGKLHRLLTRNAVKNLFHPFQPFIVGQKSFVVKMALRFGIPLIFYGENSGEYNNNTPITQKGFTTNNQEGDAFHVVDRSRLDEIHLGGVSIAEYVNQGIPLEEFNPYLPARPEVISQASIQFYYLGYFLKWHPQGAYYYAQEHCGFVAAPERTPGTYSKYNSLDDKIDDFHYYTTFIKFGIGRATYDAAQEIRSKDITREEGVSLVQRFDGEFPRRYYKEFLEYIGMTDEEFLALVEKFRPAHLWKKEGNEWKLKYQVTQNGSVPEIKKEWPLAASSR